jgi:hypothetical protein
MVRIDHLICPQGFQLFDLFISLHDADGLHVYIYTYIHPYVTSAWNSKFLILLMRYVTPPKLALTSSNTLWIHPIQTLHTLIPWCLAYWMNMRPKIEAPAVWRTYSPFGTSNDRKSPTTEKEERRHIPTSNHMNSKTHKNYSMQTEHADLTPTT